MDASAPPVNSQDLAASLERLGLRSGESVLVHSSLSSLGRVEGGAPAVISALRETVGPEGTVLFPTFTGHAGLSAQSPPVFSPHLDPCWTGTIPETARKLPDALRSLGPTHSVCALGALARWYTTGHERCQTPCGIGSPFHRLRTALGKVLFIGVKLSCNTLCHHVEELAGVPYVCVREPVAASVLLPDGGELQAPLRIHVYGPARAYPRLEPELLETGILKLGRAGHADLRLLDAQRFCEVMIPRLRTDPGLFLAEPDGWRECEEEG